MQPTFSKATLVVGEDFMSFKVLVSMHNISPPFILAVRVINPNTCRINSNFMKGYVYKSESERLESVTAQT